MALFAYLPLEGVYKFHEAAENWILRRYLPAVEEEDGAEITRPLYQESVIPLFVDRSTKRTDNLERGQAAPQQQTIYCRTRLLVTETASPQPADVLYDPAQRAWQVLSTGEWDEARGYTAVVQRAGNRGQKPF